MGFAKKIAKHKTDKMTGACKKVQQLKAKTSQHVQISYLEQNLRDTALYMETVEVLANVFTACARFKFKFGTPRVEMLMEKVNSQMDCIKQGYITSADIRRILHDELKMNLDYKPQGEMTHNRQITSRAIQDITAAFMISLADGWGYKKLRLSRYHTMAAKMVHSLHTNQLSVSQVCMMAAGKMKFTLGVKK